MSAKISKARREAFLRAARETGNQTLAAERAKVSRSWVCLHRASDPDFDAAVLRSLDAARSKLLDFARNERSGETSKSGMPRPRYHQGHELIIRGTRSGKKGASRRLVQIGRARVKQWTASSERRFLAVLGETANVKAACAAVGLTPASAYNHRDRHLRFERRWRETLNIAHIRIEYAFIEQAGAALTEGSVPCDGPIREMTASAALYLLEMHKRREAGEHNRAGRWRYKRPSPEQVIETIRRRAAAIRAARSLDFARDERGAKGEPRT